MAARPPDMNDWYTRQGLTVKGGGITLQAGGAIKGGQTAYNTGTGFFMGYSGTAYKFSIGNPSGNCLTWDGTTLTVKGSIALGSTVQWSDVTGSGKPSDNADVTLSAVNGGLSVTGGGITLSGGGSIKGGQTAYATGTGFFLGYSGSAYKFSIGSATDYLRWDGSSLDLLTSGTTKFNGNFSSGGFGISMSANENLNATIGGYFLSNTNWSSGSGAAVRAVGTNGAAGVSATTSGGSPGGVGVYGSATSVGTGIIAAGSLGATALAVQGPMTMTNTTLVTNLNADLLDGNHASAFQAAGNYPTDGTATSYVLYGTQTPGSGVATFDGSAKPGGNSTNAWLRFVINGTTYYIPVWT